MERLEREFFATLANADAVRARELVGSALDSGVSPIDVYKSVIAPSMQRIGDLWERGEISVADEHLASAIVERVLAFVYARGFVAPPRSRESLVLACVEGEHHQLGLRATADLLEGAGFVVLFLGANVPLDDLLGAVSRYRPAAIGLSATLRSSRESLARTLEAAHAVAPGVGIVVGGTAATAAASGVAIAADVGEAVATVESVLS